MACKFVKCRNINVNLCDLPFSVDLSVGSLCRKLVRIGFCTLKLVVPNFQSWINFCNAVNSEDAPLLFVLEQNSNSAV